MCIILVKYKNDLYGIVKIHSQHKIISYENECRPLYILKNVLLPGEAIRKRTQKRKKF